MFPSFFKLTETGYIVGHLTESNTCHTADLIILSATPTYKSRQLFNKPSHLECLSEIFLKHVLIICLLLPSGLDCTPLVKLNKISLCSKAVRGFLLIWRRNPNPATFPASLPAPVMISSSLFLDQATSLSETHMCLSHLEQTLPGYVHMIHNLTSFRCLLRCHLISDTFLTIILNIDFLPPHFSPFMLYFSP